MRKARVKELVIVLLPLDCWVSTNNQPRQWQRGHHSAASQLWDL